MKSLNTRNPHKKQTKSYKITRTHRTSQHNHNKITDHKQPYQWKYQRNRTKRHEFTQNHDKVTMRLQENTQNHTKYPHIRHRSTKKLDWNEPCPLPSETTTWKTLYEHGKIKIKTWFEIFSIARNLDRPPFPDTPPSRARPVTTSCVLGRPVALGRAGCAHDLSSFNDWSTWRTNSS